MVDEREWKEFKESGMLWWINTILHTFGWAIVLELYDDGDIRGAYPARVKFRGFDYKNIEEGYVKVSQFMVDNAEELLKESKDEV